VHAELVGGLALIAAMVREDLEDVALLEVADSVCVADAGGMHLENEVIKFAFQAACSFKWTWAERVLRCGVYV
jgi:hypothetical protein